MEISEKPQALRPRVVHGPHRLRLSGVAIAPFAPMDEIMPTVAGERPEIVSSTVEISVELVPFDEPK